MVKEEVEEAKSDAAEDMFVEIFNDKDAFIELLVENVKKSDDVEKEMCGGVKRSMSTREDEEEVELEKVEDPENVLNRKVTEVLDTFQEENFVVKTRFIKLQQQKGIRTVAIAHPRIQKKAGNNSFNCDFKVVKNINGNPFNITTGNGVFTNLNSDQAYGRGNIGPAQCTHIPLKSLSEDNRRRLLHVFSQEEDDEEESLGGGSQDFPAFTQSKGKETLQLCDICDYRGRDKAQFEEHRKTHFRCELCGKRFREQDDLVTHSQVHIKVSCPECKEEIQEDKMDIHKINHMKLNRFNKT